MEKEEIDGFLKMSHEELDKYMCSTFPEMFRDRNKSSQESCMHFGFSIGVGWFPLLIDLCRKLEAIRKVSGIITVFDQIKEKFGSGRFYYHLEGEIVDGPYDIKNDIWAGMVEDLISKAEHESDRTCSVCSEDYYEKISLGSWVYDLCHDCFIKINPERLPYLEMHKKEDAVKEWIGNNLRHLGYDKMIELKGIIAKEIERKDLEDKLEDKEV